MKCEPVELDLGAAARSRRDRSRHSHRAAPVDDPVRRAAATVDLIDAAFAVLGDEAAVPPVVDSRGQDRQSATCAARHGVSHQLSTPLERIRSQRQLVDKLSSQLAAIDRQREHLTELLRDIDVATITDDMDA